MRASTGGRAHPIRRCRAGHGDDLPTGGRRRRRAMPARGEDEHMGRVEEPAPATVDRGAVAPSCGGASRGSEAASSAAPDAGASKASGCRSDWPLAAVAAVPPPATSRCGRETSSGRASSCADGGGSCARPGPMGVALAVRAAGRAALDRASSDRGAATAEYAIATMAAVAFAGLLVVILQSDDVRGMLLDLVRRALTYDR